MIVRDNESTIGACLESIYPWVDEIVIVDTGSVDRTPEICRQFGARMFEFAWCDDFSAARNESLRHARGEWIFWTDSDDVVPEEQGRALRALACGNHDPRCLGYLMQVQCPSERPGEMTVVDQVKLFRRQPELRFEHRIHEQILPAITRAGGTVRSTGIFVVHTGSVQSPATRHKKLERDFRILQLDLEERPNHPFVLFNLGMTCEDAGMYEEAEVHLQQCLNVSGVHESHVPKAWALLINSLRGQGRLDDAVAAANDAISLFPDDHELLFRRAVIQQDRGRHQAAVDDYRRILNGSEHFKPRSTDPAISGYKAHHNLAESLRALEQFEAAIEHWGHAIRLQPLFPVAWKNLGSTYRDMRRVDDLKQLVKSVPDDASLRSTRALLAAHLFGIQGDLEALDRVLRSAWNDTYDADCLHELAKVLFAKGELATAIPVLEELLSRYPDDATARRNLEKARSILKERK